MIPDFCDDGKSQQTNLFKSLNLLYGIGLQGIHGLWYTPAQRENSIKKGKAK